MSSLGLLKAIGEPVRLRILHLTKVSPLTVNELSSALQISQSNVSHHLKILKEAEILTFEKNGASTLYSTRINPELPDELKALWNKMDVFFSELPERQSDLARLSQILISRKNQPWQGNDFKKWRTMQPDLPHSEEFFRAGIPRQPVAVDIGCGEGTSLPQLQLSFEQVIGIDISEDRLRVLQAKSPNATAIQAEAGALPLATSIADAVFLRMVLGFVNEPLNVVREAHRILNNGGRISVIDLDPAPNGLNKSFWVNFARENSMTLLIYQSYPGIYLCALEKI